PRARGHRVPALGQLRPAQGPADRHAPALRAEERAPFPAVRPPRLPRLRAFLRREPLSGSAGASARRLVAAAARRVARLTAQPVTLAHMRSRLACERLTASKVWLLPSRPKMSRLALSRSHSSSRRAASRTMLCTQMMAASRTPRVTGLTWCKVLAG